MKYTVLIIMMSAALAFAQLQGPRIYLPADTYDFGTIKQGEIVKHSFVVVNKGDDTLKISNVVTSCGCTAAELPKKVLEAGETVVINVQFDSHGKVGPQTKFISVASNDKDNPNSRLTLKGTITEQAAVVLTDEPKIEFTENQHDFGTVPEGGVLSYIFTYKNTGKADLEIKDIKTSCGCTAAMPSSKILKPGESGSLKVDFDTANRFGRVSRTVTVSTNEKEAPLKTITIYADLTKRESK